MTTGAPRSLRELDNGPLEAACPAARRSRLSIPEWLNKAIARQATIEESPPRSTQRDDDDALATATGSLTHRVRAMVEHACFSAGAPADLIESLVNVGQGVAETKRRRTDTSLTHVATVVEILPRDIDNADETARTTIEGMRADARESGDVGRVAEEIRRPEKGLSPDCPGFEPASSKQDRVTSASLDAIRTRLEALLAASLHAPPGTELNQTSRSAENHTRLAQGGRVDDLTDEEPSTPVVDLAARQPSVSDQIDLAALARGQRQIEESLDALHDGLAGLSSRLATLAPTNAACGSVVVDTLGRLEARLDAILGRVDTVLERSASGDAIEQLAAEISKFRHDLAERDLLFAAEIDSKLAGLTRRLDAVRPPDRFRLALKELEEQVARLASKLEHVAPQSLSWKNIEGRLLHLEHLLLASRREWAEAACRAARDAALEAAEKRGWCRPRACSQAGPRKLSSLLQCSSLADAGE